MKLGRIIDPRFKVALKKLTDQDLPIKASFILKGVVLSSDSESKKFEDVRIEAVNKLGDKKEDGSLAVDEKGIVNVNAENMKEYTEQINALLDTDIEVKGVTLKDLGDRILLSVQDLFILDDLIKE